MRKFENIKPLHMESPLIREIPKFQGGTVSGGILPAGAVWVNSDHTMYSLNGSVYSKDGFKISDSGQTDPISDLNQALDEQGAVNDAAAGNLQEALKINSTDMSKQLANSLKIANNPASLNEAALKVVNPTQASDLSNNIVNAPTSVDMNAVTKQTQTNIAQTAAMNEQTKAMQEQQELAGKLQFASKIGGISQAAAMVGDTLGSTFGKEPESEGTLKLNKVADGMADAALASGNPYAMMAGAAVKVGGALNKMTGNGGVDGKTKADLFAGSTFGFLLGGLSPDPVALALYWTNRLGAKRTREFSVDTDILDRMGDAYNDTYDNLNSAASKVGKYGLFSSRARKRANAAMDAAEQQQNVLSDMSQDTQDRQTTASWDGTGMRNEMRLTGGYKSLRAAKHGMKLNDLSFAKKTARGFKFNQELQKLKDSLCEPLVEAPVEEVPQAPESNEPVVTTIMAEEGGTFNVIPEGALHKNKHHMEDAEGLTKKGIPVVTEEEGGELVLQAEIERNEIVFRLEVTEKLEKLLKEYKDKEDEQEKSNIAIEAGKLLTKEILYNTHDNTGLIEEC